MSDTLGMIKPIYVENTWKDRGIIQLDAGFFDIKDYIEDYDLTKNSALYFRALMRKIQEYNKTQLPQNKIAIKLDTDSTPLYPVSYDATPDDVVYLELDGRSDFVPYASEVKNPDTVVYTLAYRGIVGILTNTLPNDIKDRVLNREVSVDLLRSNKDRLESIKVEINKIVNGLAPQLRTLMSDIQALSGKEFTVAANNIPTTGATEAQCEVVRKMIISNYNSHKYSTSVRNAVHNIITVFSYGITEINNSLGGEILVYLKTYPDFNATLCETQNTILQVIKNTVLTHPSLYAIPQHKMTILNPAFGLITSWTDANILTTDWIKNGKFAKSFVISDNNDHGYDVRSLSDQ